MALGSDNSNQDASPRPPGAVTIKVFSTETAAEAAAALLEANQITCWLHADDCGGMLSVLDAAHGVKLLVNPADAEAVRALLGADAIVPPSHSPVTPSPGMTNSIPPSPRIKISLPQVAAGIVLGVLLCLLYQWSGTQGTKTYRYDTNQDGRTDSVWVYRDGECIELNEDRDFDGHLDVWSSFEHGYRRVSAKADNNFDGEPDTWWCYSNNLAVSSRADTDFNGTPDMTNFFKHEQVTRSDWQPNGTNVITLRQFFHHGVLRSEVRDTNWDGTFDVSVQFDAFENPVSTNTFNPQSSAP